MTIWNALSRFVLYPLLVALGDSLIDTVQFATVSQWAIVGAVIAAFSVAADMTVLDRLGHIGGLMLDWVGSSLIIWLSPIFLPGAYVSPWGAIGVGMILSLSELVLHLLVQQARRAGYRSNRP